MTKTNSWMKTSFVTGLLTLSFLGFAGCKKSAEDAVVASTDPVASLNPLATFYLQVYRGTDSHPVTTHKLVGGIAGDTDWTQLCTIDRSEINTTTAADIMCIAEMHELDVKVLGAKINVNVPPGVCEYVTETTYYFWKLQPGTGTAAYGAAFWNITPTCSFDYTSAGGPNCCAGNWTITSSDGTTTKTGSYGGHHTNCLAGPDLETWPKTSSKEPKVLITYTKGEPYKKERVLKDTMSYVSNIMVANYWRPSDHGYAHGGNLSTDKNLGGATSPIAFAKVGAYETNPYYEWGCYDNNHERKGRIRLMIREWNMFTDLAQGGNPDRAGSTVNNDQINDFPDWTDIGVVPTAYPGLGL